MTSGKEIRSKFKLEFDTPGADQAKKKVDKIRESLGKLGDGSKAVNANALSAITHRNLKQMAVLQKQVGQLAGSFKSLNEAVQKLTASINHGGGGGRGRGGGGGPPPAGGAGPSGGGGGGGPSPAPRRGSVRGGSRHPGSFFRGLIQGAGFGEFYPDQSRAGMMKQAGGRMLGQMGAGIASMPFTGLQGMQQGLAGIPFVGGIAAGALSAGQADAQKALGYQQNLLGLAPYLNTRNIARAHVAASTARSGVLARGITHATEADVLTPALTANQDEAEREAIFDARRPGSGSAHQNVIMPTPIGGGGGGQLASIGSARRDVITQAMREEDTRRQGILDTEADRAARAAQSGMNPLGNLNSAAANLGAMDANEAAKFAQGLLGRSGGQLGGKGLGSEFVNNAIAAKTVFGAGGDITGAFGQAARRGGIVGGGNSSEALIKAIQAGMSAGMDDSEVRDFLQTVAQAQEQFLRTGIPVNPQSMATAMGTMASTGLGVGRGSAVGQQLTGHAQQISQTGPQSAADMLMLQKFGNFKGGGLDDLESAMEKLENLQDLKPEQFLDFISSISKGSGGGSQGRYALRSVFGGMGAKLGIGESKLIQKAADGGQLTDGEKKQVAAIQSEMARRTSEAQGLGGTGLQNRASGTVGTLAPGVRTQAGIENLNIAIGQKLLPTMANFEKVAQKSAESLKEFAPTLEAVSGATLGIASKLPGIAAGVQDIFNLILRFIGRSGGPGSGLG